MAEYIERDKFRNILEAKAEMAFGTPKQVFYNTIAMLDLIPAADVAEVVRCKDCAFRGDMFDCECWHSPVGEAGLFTDDDFYCSCGVRRSDDE